MTDYWFARYKPAVFPQRSSRGLIPLNWKGRTAIATFVLGMVLGGLSFLFLGLRDQFFPGIVCFVVLAVAGASFFLWASIARTDPTKSAYDYLKERQH
jgi:hypothetical protein